MQDLANAILRGDINIAQGGEIRFYGCYTDALASELQWNLTHVANGATARPDIRVTGFQGPANLGQNPRLTLGTWRMFYGLPQQETRGRNLGYR